MTDYEAAFWKLQNNWHESVKHYEDRIDKLEAALRLCACDCEVDCSKNAPACESWIARKTLEEKDD